jgi:pathogenesis-related protein 1
MKMTMFLHFQLILFFNLLFCVVPIIVLMATTDHELVSEFVGPQNDARAKVGAPPLLCNDGVSNYAEAYANQRKVDCTLKHSNGPYAENLFWGGGCRWKPKDAAALWISEYSSFNYNSCMCHHNDTCRHYSQIVWRNSQRVDYARVVCQTSDTFMTCNYYPPGNYEGQKAY